MGGCCTVRPCGSATESPISRPFGTQEGELSDCLRCDEKLCGPAFISCAGANRRRAGVVSDIERNGTHVCKEVDVGPGAMT